MIYILYTRKISNNLICNISFESFFDKAKVPTKKCFYLPQYRLGLLASPSLLVQWYMGGNLLETVQSKARKYRKKSNGTQKTAYLKHFY